MKSKLKTVLYFLIPLVIINSFLIGRTEIPKLSEYYRFDSFSMGKNLSMHLGEITPDVVISQTFIGKKNNLTQLNLFVSTFNRENNGDLILQIFNKNTKQMLRQKTIPNSSLKDNRYINIKFEPVENAKGVLFELKISSSKTDLNNSVTVWRDTSVSKGSLYHKASLLQGDLVVDFIYENKSTISSIIWNNILFLILNMIAYLLFRHLKYGSE